MQIDGSRALVVGGGSGLGEATARALAERGALVTVADIDPDRAISVADGLGTEAVICDVCDGEAVAAAVAQAAAGQALRISVCCAGIGWAEKIAGSSGPHAGDPFERVVRVNLIGTFNVLRHAASTMLAAEPREEGERGVCINTASIAAFDGQVGQVAYAASKAGVVGMTLPAARDLARGGVRVNTIAPGLFDTPLLAALPQDAREALGAGIPWPPRLGRPSEFAQLACQIVENRMLNGETIRLDGALRMPPR